MLMARATESFLFVQPKSTSTAPMSASVTVKPTDSVENFRA